MTPFIPEICVTRHSLVNRRLMDPTTRQEGSVTGYSSSPHVSRRRQRRHSSSAQGPQLDIGPLPCDERAFLGKESFLTFEHSTSMGDEQGHGWAPTWDESSTPTPVRASRRHSSFLLSHQAPSSADTPGFDMSPIAPLPEDVSSSRIHEVTVVSEQGSHAKGVDPLILSCHQTNPEAYRPGRTHRESTATSSQGSREDMAPSRRYHSVNFPNTLSNRPRKCRLRPIQSPSRQPEHKTVSNADPWRLPHPTNPVRVAFTESTAPFSLHPRLHPRLHSRAWHQRPWPFPRQRFRR